MILFSIIALSVISGSVFVYLMDLMKNWYDFWMLPLAYVIFFVVFIICFVLFIIIYTYLISMKKEARPSKFSCRFVKRICELVVQIFKIRIHTRGKELLPEEKSLYVCNHISNLDPLVAYWAYSCYDFSFIVKDSLLRVPFVKKVLHQDGHLALDRNNNRKGLEVILKSIDIIKNDKRNIFVFPEGTRSKDGVLNELHSGTFKIAQKAKAPIVVSVIVNTNSVKRRWAFKQTKVYLDVIKVLYYDDYKDMQTNDLSDYVYNLMKERLEELESLKY